MNNRIFMFGSLVILFLSCTENQLEVASASFSEENLDSCQEVSCPEITVNYLQIIGDEDIATLINNDIKKFIVQSLYIGDEEEAPTAVTIDEAAKAFIAMYRMENAEFPGMSAEYFVEVTVSENLSTPEIFALEMRNYLFTGGAHGYGSVQFNNYDPQTGLALTIKDLFEDVSVFTAFVEERFRREYQINSSKSINDTGFRFENDVFALPETIGFTKDHLIIHYNQYEIASYAAGPVELEIPIKDVAPFLTFSLED